MLQLCFIRDSDVGRAWVCSAGSLFDPRIDGLLTPLLRRFSPVHGMAGRWYGARAADAEGPRGFRSTGRVSVAAQSGPWARRACREEEALFRRADYLGPAAGGR